MRADGARPRLPGGTHERTPRATRLLGRCRRLRGVRGRWSRLVAPRFLDWLAVPPARRWLDVGCGTGALSQAILASADPAEVVGVDPSLPFVAHAAVQVPDARAAFRK